MTASVSKAPQANAASNAGGITILIPAGRALSLLAEPARWLGLNVKTYVGDLRAAFEEAGSAAIVVTDAEGPFPVEDDARSTRSFIGAETVWIHILNYNKPAQIGSALRCGFDGALHWQSTHRERQSVLIDAIQSYHDRIRERNLREQEEGILRRQVQWLSYKETIRQLNNEISGQNAISSLCTSLYQGAGFGLILSIIETMKMVGVANGNDMVVDAGLFEELVAHARFARRMIVSLEEYLKAIERPLHREQVSVVDLQKLLIARFQSMVTRFAQKSMSLRMAENSSRNCLSVDQTMIEQAVEELLLNALKYSKKESDVTMFVSVQSGYCMITVQSFPDEYAGFELNSDLERLKQPFVRHHPPVEDVFEGERFVMGLGLSAVEHIAVRHNGVFMLERCLDHTRTIVEQCIAARILIPLD